MDVRRLEDVVAFQLAVDFKLAVYRLIRESPGARGDWRYRAHLTDLASSVESCITEGWHRNDPAECAAFLRYSRGSLADAVRCLQEGVARGYFPPAAIDGALVTAHRCGAALTHLRRRRLRRT